MSLFQSYRDQTRQTIYSEAVAQFELLGYDKTTISSITKKVGIAKGTFYNFFESKQDILFVWAQQQFLQMDIEKAMEKDKTVHQNLTSLAMLTAKAIDSTQSLFQVFLTEMLKATQKRELEKNIDFLDLYRRVIEISKDADAVIDDNLQVKIQVVNGALYMGIVEWLKNKTTENLAQYLCKIVDVLATGLYHTNQ